MAEEFERLLAEVHNPICISEMAVALRDGQDLSEVGALACLMHVFSTGDTDLLEEALQPDVRFIAKHFPQTGFGAVMQRLRETWEYRQKRVLEAVSLGVDPAVFQGRPDWGLAVTLVDKRIAGPCLVHLGNTSESGGAIGRYTVAMSRQAGAAGVCHPLRISGIFFSHFQDYVSGRVTFADVSCVPDTEVLAKGTEFRIDMTPRDEGGCSLSITTLTDVFSIDLGLEDRDRIRKWLDAAACGVDRCTAYLWGGFEFCARSLAPGWVHLLIRSSRLEQRYCLSGVMPVSDLLRSFQRIV